MTRCALAPGSKAAIVNVSELAAATCARTFVRKDMSIKGEASRYGSIAIALHWLSAAAILTTLPIGFATALLSVASDHSGTAFLSFASRHSGTAAPIFRAHVSLGILILLLTLTRLFWRFFDQRPDEAPGQPHWQALTASVLHWLLYGLLIIIPISGIGLIILSSAIPVLLMDVSGPLPSFFKFWPAIVHSLAAFTLIGLLFVHVGAVLYHQHYKRDGLLARMGVKFTRVPKS
jgi:cytochrome b561